MHVTILALGSRGDIQPYATLGKGLQSAGHQVRFVTFENFAQLAETHGLDFHPIHGDAQALVARGGANMLALIRSFGSLAEGYACDLSAPILKETDVIINQLPLALYGYDLAEKFDLPMFVAAVMPLVPTQAFPMMGFPALPFPGYNRLTYYLAQQIGWQMFRPIINRWRRQVLGLPPLPTFGYFNQLGTQRFPVLDGFSTHVVPRPPDWSEHVHITGYWFPEDETWQPSDDLRTFIEAGPPPVFIGFGSMPVRNPERTTKIVLEALKQSNQRGILHTGWGGIGECALPDYVFKINYAPYGWLFPRMAMVIHHGGSGTTAFGVRAGVPTLVVPFIFDQFYWGERIAALGVGPKPIPYQRLSVARLAKVITMAISDPQMRQRAAELGQKTRGENGIAKAIEIIQHYVSAHRS
jgi:UDP:flavonoid glycosyltransferase YjiC (YdhE family)